MKVFTNNTFTGVHPVGTAAVVHAADAVQAAADLREALKKEGLDQVITPESTVPFPDPTWIGSPRFGFVRILNNGDY